MRASALYHVAARRVESREVILAGPGTKEVLIESCCSAISPGTETMIFNGAFPKDVPLDGGIASLKGGFEYPFPYGYALVGKVTAVGPEVGADLIGRLVFAFHPHQDRAIVPLSDCCPLPEDVSPEGALFLPTVETALNLVMDGAPLVGERVLVFGQGVVGFLTARLLAEFPLERLVAVEPLGWRRDLAQHWGVRETIDPTDAVAWERLLAGLHGVDLSFEVSGNPAALDLGIAAAGFDGRIVVGSWYGANAHPLDLGGKFHRNRVRLISSQVSTLAPALTGRWTKPRRIALAWRTVARLEPQRLVGQAFTLGQCQQAFEAASAPRDGLMQVIFRY